MLRAAATRHRPAASGVGLPKEFFGAGLDAVRAPPCDAVRSRWLTWKGSGRTLVDVSLPRTELSIPVYYIIAPAEASARTCRASTA